MGEYADEQIERDMRAAARAHGVEVDDDSQVGFFRAQKEARQEERHDALASAKERLPQTEAALAELGLTLVRKSEFHYHIVRINLRRQTRTLVAQWWPSSGKTMDGLKKGQRCTTGKALVSWLRAKQEATHGR